jgi:hypothetical protein
MVPAQLRVAKSKDGGRTWAVKVVDKQAPEAGDLVDQSVSIGGDGHGTIYVAYLVQTSGAFDDMKLKIARSSDGGRTWDRSLVAQGGVGNYNSIRVIDEETVLISTTFSGQTSGTRLYSTVNGGRFWASSDVDTFGWYSAVDSTNNGRIWLSYFNPGSTSLHSATSLSRLGPWETGPVAGAGGDDNFTGLGASLDAARNGEVYVAFEDFQQARGRSVVKVARTEGPGEAWELSRLQASPVVGWNTSIDVLPTDAEPVAFTSYWYAKGTPLVGKARLAYSDDGAASWEVFRVPEHRYVDPYLDMSAPARRVQYVTYQVKNGEGERFLRLARLHVARE